MNTPDNDPDELDELDAGLRAIVRAAAELPELSPSRDLWSGIESRIDSPVIALPRRRLAIAASLLIVATAGVTFSIMKHGGTADLAARRDPAAVEAPLTGVPVAPVSLQTAEQTFDREIGAMRTIIAERRKDLDPVTLSVLQKNLKLIDAAIAESKAALAKDPASAFLLDRLTHVYDTKLQLLRGVANIPAHG